MQWGVSPDSFILKSSTALSAFQISDSFLLPPNKSHILEFNFCVFLINYSNHFGNQVIGSMLNTKTAMTVCPVDSFHCCRLQTHREPALFELEALSSLYFLLPSLLFTQPSLLINYSSFAEKKQPPACRRHFFAIYSQNLLLLIPEGCRKTALEDAEATIKTEVVHSMVSLKSTARVPSMHQFSY